MRKSFIKPVLAAVAAAGMVCMISWMYPALYHSAADNSFTTSLKEKTRTWNERAPEDRLYLQFDKPFYEPGETIWFSAFVRDGVSLKPSTKSEMLYVDLMSPKGTVEKTIKILARDGQGKGDFAISEMAAGGMYKVRAYTQWMRNFSSGTYGFEKDIQVQDVILPNLKMKLDFEKKAYGPGDEVSVKLEVNTNENKPLSNQKVKVVVNIGGEKFTEEMAMTDVLGQKKIKFKLPNKLKSNDGLVNIMMDYNGNTESVSRSIPIVLNNIKLEFFPEGGDLVNGMGSKVAFRALNEFGKPADVDGVVLDSKGKEIASFSSFHFGMGAFNMIPSDKEQYTVKITRPEGVKTTYSLPTVQPTGYTLAINNTKPGEVGIKINSNESKELSLIGQVRGKIVYSTALKVKSGENLFLIPSSSFPIGVAQFTLFDENGVEVCERLAFMNKKKQLNVNITTDKEKYMPREKVNMTITVTDEHGAPAAADLALTVMNDQLNAFADDRQGNILAKLLLESDLKQKVEEPNFYFDKKEAKADQALDFLLLTSGWRRFEWKQVIARQFPPMYYQGERAVVSGVVYNAYTSQPVPNATIKMNSNGNVFKTDASGRFIFNKLELFEPVTFTVDAPQYNANQMYVNTYNPAMYVYLYPKNNQQYQSYYYDAVPSSDGDAGVMELEDVQFVPVQRDEMKVQVQQQKKDNAGNGVKNKSRSAGFDDFAPKKSAPAPMPKSTTVVTGTGNNVQVKSGTIVAFGAPDSKPVDQKNVNDPVSGKELKKKGKAEKFGPMGNVSATGLYRSREFAAPQYKDGEIPTVREDFRSTVYWNPEVQVGANGVKTVAFYNSDEITSFRAVAEGVGNNGSVGRGEKVIFTQTPIAMTVKAPVEVATLDQISIPLTLKNNTAKPVSGMLRFTAPEGMKLMGSVTELQTIAPGKAKTVLLQYEVGSDARSGNLSVEFSACGMKDAFSQPITIVAKGFPVAVSYNGTDRNGQFKLDIRNMIKGSLRVKFAAFPSVVGDILTGLDGILREPHGCFEQTSMSSWPNTMVLDYYQNTDEKNTETMQKAADLLKRGYSRLVTFETNAKGYQWFGQAPAHEGLTAYGIMQFSDMQRVGAEVDKDMLKRTSDWLMEQRDGNGGYRRNTTAYHAFGSISPEVMNGYITYALAESGYSNMEKEVNASYKNAMESKDPYQLALIANTLGANKDSRYNHVMQELLKTQKSDGSFSGSTHSITHSTGQSLTIETTSLAIIAMLKDPGGSYSGNLINSVKWLASSRNSYGTFGNTQGTVLALKAMTEYAKKSKKAKEGGTIELYVDGRKVDEVKYEAGQEGTIEMDGLEKYITKGNEDIKVKFTDTKESLPYTVSVEYSTSLPNSNKECVIDLDVKISEKTVKQGETVRLKATVKNLKKEGVPSTMVVVGIPAGFSVQPWQLKEMQEKKMFDYYEIIGNKLAIYYTGMAPEAVKELNFDLKAEIPGTYEAPASAAYLYYTNEFKTWTNYGTVTIN
ncbi:MAG: hypothetical protein IT233_13475 [Bacteroidia bacterium]|nr:hypothetical protein [Bacteroidia bacterium]